jgi:hypothetical protein
VLQSDRGITYADEVPAGSRLVEGQWWKPGDQGALVSFEKKIAEGLGLKLGDPVTVNVLGRNLTARIANLRTVDWQSLGINFVMVFSPATFRGAPATHIATLTYPGGSIAAEETALLKAAAEAFPSVTTVRVREAIDAVGGTVEPGAGIRPPASAAVAAGARRGARGRPPPPGLRCGGAQDRGRHARHADLRLRTRIFGAGARYRHVRGRGRVGRRRAGHHPGDESAVLLAAGAGHGRSGCDRQRDGGASSAPSPRSARSRRRSCGRFEARGFKKQPCPRRFVTLPPRTA